MFENRTAAGRLLAQRLQGIDLQNPIIFALPRGGVPIGFEIAKLLRSPLEVLVVRKIGAPFNPEYGIGAITEDGSYWIDSQAAEMVGVGPIEIEQITRDALSEVKRRVEQYRKGHLHREVHGRTAVIVDDGLATGVTARVACHYLRAHGAEKIILATPVCAADTAETLMYSEVADEVICLDRPDDFRAVGQFYQDFNQVSDEEVIALLEQARSLLKASPIRKEVNIKEGDIILPGSVNIPVHAKGLVIFAHGSGSSRLSPRNQQVAEALAKAGLGTLLFDLLTEEESRNRANVFDISLLASRLVLATKWMQRRKYAKELPISYFGASTGAAAALLAAARLRHTITAVVSRGGRPDLAIPNLHLVTAPTLLIVGGNDEQVIDLNQVALKYLVTASLVVIPGATHLFEESGALEKVSSEAVSWFLKYIEAKVVREVA